MTESGRTDPLQQWILGMQPLLATNFGNYAADPQSQYESPKISRKTQSLIGGNRVAKFGQ